MICRQHSTLKHAYYIDINRNNKSIVVLYFNADTFTWHPYEFDIKSRVHNTYVFESTYSYQGCNLRITASYITDTPILRLNYSDHGKWSSVQIPLKVIAKQRMMSTEEYKFKVLQETFFERHQEMFDEDKTSCWTYLFYSPRTNINTNWSLDKILAHAQSANNRSRKICMELNLMDASGALTKNGLRIKNEFDQYQSTLSNKLQATF